MKKVRIVDVATLAGVSKSTVSQFLNGRFGHMSADTKQRIENAVSELNYVPNSIARSLKTDKTKTIGVIVRDISGLHTSRVLRGIDDYCKKLGYNVLIYNSDFDADAEKQALVALQQLCVDSIIITSSGLNTELINQFNASGLPVVQFQLEYPDCPGDIVLSDYHAAAFKATEYLIQQGHTRIGFIAQPFTASYSRLERYQGYLDALRHYDIEPSDELLMQWERDSGFEQSPVAVLNSENPPTALFTQHLAITIELLQVLGEAGIAIPEKVSVLGFDEIPMVELFKTPVSVIKQDAHQIGIESAKLAIEALDKTERQSRRIIVPSELVIRDSIRSI